MKFQVLRLQKLIIDLNVDFMMNRISDHINIQPLIVHNFVSVAANTDRPRNFAMIKMHSNRIIGHPIAYRQIWQCKIGGLLMEN
jgi:hypothetical protein